MFHADGHVYMTKLIAAFCSFANLHVTLADKLTFHLMVRTSTLLRHICEILSK